MLVLSRKQGQRVLIGQEIEVTVLEVRGSRVKLGFRGPAEVPIHREELHQCEGSSPFSSLRPAQQYNPSVAPGGLAGPSNRGCWLGGHIAVAPISDSAYSHPV